MDSAIKRLPQNGRKEEKRSKIFTILIIMALIALVGGAGYALSEKNGRGKSVRPSSAVGELSAMLNGSSGQNSSDVSSSVPAKPSQVSPSLASNSQVSLPPNINATAVPTDDALGKTYNNTILNYSVKYPNDWIYEIRSDGSALFSGPESSPAYDSTIEIDKIAGGNLDSAYAIMKNGYTDDTNAKAQISNEQNYTYTMSDGTKIQGRAFESTYTDTSNANTSYHDMVVVVPRGNDSYVWIYSSPEGQYDTYLKTAQAMLGTWMFNK